jgi:PAS domain S-box-containing protein
VCKSGDKVTDALGDTVGRSAAHEPRSEDREGARRLVITERESDVLVRVQRGLENKTIAFELGLAEQSVKEHVSVLLRKFAVANRTALAGAASRLEVTGEARIDQSWLPQFFRDATPLICVLRGPDLRYEAVNEAFRHAVGDRPLIGRTMRESFPELEGQGIFERTERVYATGQAEVEHEATRSWDAGHGIERRQVELVLQPLHDEDRNVNGVMSFAIDVTELTAARRRAELVREEFVALLDLVPNGVLITDETGHIVTMNAAAQRIARWPTEVIDTPISRALGGETVVDELQTFEGGDPPREFRRRLTARPLRDADGHIRGAIAIFTEL